MTRTELLARLDEVAGILFQTMNDFGCDPEVHGVENAALPSDVATVDKTFQGMARVLEEGLAKIAPTKAELEQCAALNFFI